MKERKTPEPVGAAPIVTAIETDARIHVRIDVSRLLQEGGIDSESGEPSPAQLEAYVLMNVERFLQEQACILDARVRWLDVEFLMRSEWPGG